MSSSHRFVTPWRRPARRGITVLLVTGRIISELRRVAGDLHFVDGVVAENGAVIHFPESGHTTILAPPVPPQFLDELRRRGIAFQSGQCLVDADANDAARLLDVIRTLELPLVLIFNGGRVMTLPQGVSKATGLHAALDTLRLSPRQHAGHRRSRRTTTNCCAWRKSAPRWSGGVPPCGRQPTSCCPGAGPPAVAEYLRKRRGNRALPTPAAARRRLLLGYTEDGREFSLAVRGPQRADRRRRQVGQVVGGRAAVRAADPPRLLRLRDRSRGRLSIARGAARRDGARRRRSAAHAARLLRALRYPDRSVVIDLSHRPQDEKIGYIRGVLPALNEIRRRTGLPHRIVVDEAHYFLHDADVEDLLDLDQNGYTVVTYCAVAPAEGAARGHRGHDRHVRIESAGDRGAQTRVRAVRESRRRTLGDAASSSRRSGGGIADYGGGRRRACGRSRWARV